MNSDFGFGLLVFSPVCVIAAGLGSCAVIDQLTEYPGQPSKTSSVGKTPVVEKIRACGDACRINGKRMESFVSNGWGHNNCTCLPADTTLPKP